MSKSIEFVPTMETRVQKRFTDVVKPSNASLIDEDDYTKDNPSLAGEKWLTFLSKAKETFTVGMLVVNQYIADNGLDHNKLFIPKSDGKVTWNEKAMIGFKKGELYISLS